MKYMYKRSLALTQSLGAQTKRNDIEGVEAPQMSKET